MKIYQIFGNTCNNNLLFECHCESFKECVERAVKEGIDLSHSILSNQNLEGINLSNINLECVTLIGTNLTNAILIGTRLKYADLTNTILTDANLTDADLTIAILIDAILNGANLTNADLTDCKLTNANFTNAILIGAKLIRANLNNAKFVNTILENANLITANLIGAKIIGVNLKCAKLSYADFTNAIIQDSDFTNTILTCVKLTNITLDDNTLLKSILVSNFNELHTKFETLQQELNNKSYHLAKLLLNTIDERISLCGDEKDNIHSFDIIFDWFDEYTNNIEQHHIKTIYKDSDDMLYIEDENEANYELSELDIDVQIKVIVRLIAFSKKESKVE